DGLADALAEAKTRLDEGDIDIAREIYLQILAQEQDHPSALAGVMRCYMAHGEPAKARNFLAKVPAEIARHAEIVSVRTALELAAQAPVGSAVKTLTQRLAANPDDHQTRHDLAMAYYANGDHPSAVEELLEIVRRDRAWNEDAARKQLVRLFEAFGPTDPLPLAGRRRLSSLLFS
ncbi:MAG: tetratricopeptide repeat protein, partial [Alphaproteobacteria bacterium]|nr:tetratricopeptide repeat protein [Alphaproteobacteria bacterium]